MLNDFYGRRQRQSWLDIMQVCLNGHVINAGYQKHPLHNKDRCDRCGARTITNCPNCNKPIPGDMQDTGAVVLSIGKSAPKFCQSCGEKFPWTTQREEKLLEAEKVDENQGVTSLCSAFILTALSVEYLAVRDHLTNLQEVTHPQGTVYEQGDFESTSQSWKVGIAEVGAGNPRAALEAERAIQHFKPDVILFVGVAGGIKDVALGDVVVAEKVYGYESGKAGETFRPRPEVGNSTYRMVQRARAEARKENWFQRIKAPQTAKPRAFVRPIAAGEKVVASTRSDVCNFIQLQYSDALAVEMEGFGFLEAAQANLGVEALVIRGISDLINHKAEADASGSQEVAAQNASAFAFEVLANLVIPGRIPLDKALPGSNWDDELDATKHRQGFGIANMSAERQDFRAPTEAGLEAQLQGIESAIDELEAEHEKGTIDIGRYLRLKKEYETLKAEQEQKNKLAGINQARDADKNQSYLIPVDVNSAYPESKDLQRELSTAPLYDVPFLPAHYLERNEHLGRIRELLLQGPGRNVGITSISRAVGLQGMGGIGKSILAAAIARDERIRSAFPDGIVWVTLGQTPDIVNAQRRVLEHFDALETILESPQHGKSLLSKQLADKKILLILDDVWKIEHAEPFNISAAPSKLLITTRHAQVLTGFSAEECEINVLSAQQALNLLGIQSRCSVDAMPEQAQQILEECGALPLAISMIGAMLKNKPPSRWQRALEHLQNAELQRIHQRFVNYPYPNLFKALHVSVEAQPPVIQKCYLSLAIFPEDTRIPEAVLEIYWDAADLQHYDALDIVDELVDASLIFRYDENNLTLHDLQLDYVRSQCANLKQCHEKLIDAYAEAYPSGWHTIPYKSPFYFHDNFIFHSRQAGNEEKASDIAENLLNRGPLLIWHRALTYGELTGKTPEQIARQLIKKHNEPHTLARCVKILGNEAKEDARRLLKEPQSKEVIIACLQLLRNEAKEDAQRLLKEHQDCQVITVCLKLLGSEAKEDARRLLKKRQEHQIIAACLNILRDEAKEDARRLLKEHRDPEVIIVCLDILGKDAADFALAKLKSKNWSQFNQFMKAAILKVPVNAPVRQKRALEILSEWHRYAHRALVTAALMVFDKHPEKVTRYCQEIIKRWEREIDYYIREGRSKYSGHITKAMSHPDLQNSAKLAASAMLVKEGEQPGFLDEELREQARKISAGKRLRWDRYVDEVVD